MVNELLTRAPVVVGPRDEWRLRGRMFPRSFNARIAERMAIWGAMIAFLFVLYAATEIIQFWKMAAIGSDMRAAITRAATLSDGNAALAGVVEQLEAINAREAALLASNRQNK